jgi:poly(A) polymerase
VSEPESPVCDPPVIAPDWLVAEPVRAVLDALAPAGPLFVGGCVRDALLGRPTNDVDLCVACPPARTVALLEAAGLKAVPTGFDHGTVTAVANGRGFEVTTLRRDVATDGRHAQVAFTDDVALDAARRDFTMNALYADGAGRVRDPLGGLADLRAGRVRFIGDAARRIAEDRLRVLRFFRFTAWFSRTGVDARGLAACAAAADTLGRLSAERVGQEMRRLLAAPDPAPALTAMAQSRVLEACTSGADPAAVAALTQAERAAGAAPDWRRRAAAMGGDTARWRLSRAEAKALAARAAALAQARAGVRPAPLAAEHGLEAARDALLIAGGLPPDAEDELARGAAATLPVAARDLAQLGVPAGPATGAALRRLRALWLNADLRPDRATLLAALNGGNL